MDRRILARLLVIALVGACTIFAGLVHGQVPYPPRAPEISTDQESRPPGQGVPRQRQQPPVQGVPQQGQQPRETRPVPGEHAAAGTAYAFKPDLTNAQYGRCLSMERHWKNLWQQYNEGYNNARQMYPADPRLTELSYHLANLKQQLDAAWQQFSSECIYFPQRKP